MFAKQASQSVGSLFRRQRYFTPETIKYLYKANIRSCIVHWRLVNLICPVLSTIRHPLSHRRVVASISLFYKYYHGKCSQELLSMVPHGRLKVRSTRFYERWQQYAVDIPRCNFYQTSFFPRPARLWNSLYADYFPSEYNLPAFKSRVNRFLLSLH